MKPVSVLLFIASIKNLSLPRMDKQTNIQTNFSIEYDDVATLNNDCGNDGDDTMVMAGAIQFPVAVDS